MNHLSSKSSRGSLSLGNNRAPYYFLLISGVIGVTASTAVAATDVAAGSDLGAYIYAATEANHEFNLLGNVNMNGIGFIDTPARNTIYIEGNGYTITKAINENTFTIQAGAPNPSLTIRNANITSADLGTSPGTINVGLNVNNAVIDLDGTTIYGTRGSIVNFGAALSTASKNTLVKGNVTFDANSSFNDAAGAVAVGTAASMIFEDKTTFTNNKTENYGGAVSVFVGASLTFKDHALFSGNHVTNFFGGALDIWGGDSKILFENGATFNNNYAKNDIAHIYGVRGGAIYMGYQSSTAASSPQLEINGASEFTGNYVWGRAGTVAVGGAIALAASADDPLSGSQINSNFVYGATIAEGTFTDNYAYSETGNGYGGAIFSKSYDSTLSLGSGSSFSGNMAKTLGGAIYFDQGTINLDGNVTFSGNRHGVTFSTAGGVLTPDANSGRANAIYFAVSANTAKLNLNAGAGEKIHFADPIESAAGKTVTVNKTGMGTALFSDHNSDILAQTTVSEGTFELGNGVTYGRLGTAATSNFHLASGATLRGGAGATLRANEIRLDGRVEVATGEFSFDGSDVALSNTSVISLTIYDANNYSSINMGGHSLALNDASLEITATNYVPSQNISDTFVLVSDLSETATGMFAQGEQVVINGAEFQIIYGTNSITLQQLTVPEPSTYAAILAVATGACLLYHRRKTKV